MTSSVSLSTSTKIVHTLPDYLPDRSHTSPDSVKADQESKLPRLAHDENRLMQKVLRAGVCFRERIRRSHAGSTPLEMQEKRQLLERLRLTLQSNVLNQDLHGATKRLSERITGLLDKFMAAETFFRNPIGTAPLVGSFWVDLIQDATQLVNSIQEEISAGTYVGSQPALFKEFGRIMSELALDMGRFNRTIKNRNFPSESIKIDRNINENMRKLGNDISSLRNNMQKSWTLCKVEKVLLAAVLDLIRNSQNFLNTETSQSLQN